MKDAMASRACLALLFGLILAAGPAALNVQATPSPLVELSGAIFLVGGLGALIGMAYAVARARLISPATCSGAGLGRTRCRSIEMKRAFGRGWARR